MLFVDVGGTLGIFFVWRAWKLGIGAGCWAETDAAATHAVYHHLLQKSMRRPNTSALVAGLCAVASSLSAVDGARAEAGAWEVARGGQDCHRSFPAFLWAGSNTGGKLEVRACMRSCPFFAGAWKKCCRLVTLAAVCRLVLFQNVSCTRVSPLVVTREASSKAPRGIERSRWSHRSSLLGGGLALLSL